MARVLPYEVTDIMGLTLSDDVVFPYITGANVLVTAALATSGLGTDVLKEIERWLAAHMIAVTRSRVAKEAGAGGAYIKYAGVWEDELSSTQFGQMVLTLDTTNTLRNLKDGKKQASIYVVPGV